MENLKGERFEVRGLQGESGQEGNGEAIARNHAVEEEVRDGSIKYRLSPPT